MAKELWAHQKRAVEFSRVNDSVALFYETGTGKSRTAIEIVKDKCRIQGRQLKVLILTPQVVTFNWKKEFGMYSDVPGKHVIVLHGSGKDRLKQLTKTPTYFVVIANYETLLMDSVFEQLRSWGPEVIVCDESHRIKNFKAQRTKRAIALGQNARVKLLLSGTPVTQNQCDLFSQFLFLDNGATFGKSFFTFKNAYFVDENASLKKMNRLVTWPKWVPRKSRELEFNNKVMTKALSVKKDDCLDLPPLIQQTIEVDMSAEQLRAYKAMKADYITFINSKAFSANLAVTKAMRLSQIMTGFVASTDSIDEFGNVTQGSVHRFKDVPRLKALVELLEDLVEDGKVIVWAHWRENQRMIDEALNKAKIEHRMLVGGMNAEAREKSIADFREDPGVRVIVGSQAAGGIGINLIEANASVYYSRSFNLEHDVQSVARNYRGGSEIHKKITRYDLVSPGTIDEDVLKSLSQKLQIADSIISGDYKL